jgi:hypothetical protein
MRQVIKCDAMKSLDLKSFGQEFYPHEAARALRLAEKLKTGDRALLTQRIADGLPQASAQTRRRLAAKIIQRYFVATRHKLAPWPQQAFAHLVSKTRDATAQIELLYFQLAQTDEVVGAIARELFYPVCIALTPPREYSRLEFAARNGQRLLETSPLLTREFILAHAREQWNFSDRATLDRALRVLLGAGLIARQRMTELRGHPAAFRWTGRDVSPQTFAWALHWEYSRHDARVIPETQILESDFARTLLLNPSQIEAHIEIARRHQLVACEGKNVRLLFQNGSTLVEVLLDEAM